MITGRIESFEFRQCDFCDSVLNDDERLHPVIVGEPEKAGFVRLHSKDDYKELPKGPTVYGYESHQVIGIINAIKDAPNASMSMSRHSTTGGFGANHTVVTSIDVRPEGRQEVEPDMMVCEFCVRNLKS